jgi:hypothetical protein
MENLGDAGDWVVVQFGQTKNRHPESPVSERALLPARE